MTYNEQSSYEKKKNKKGKHYNGNDDAKVNYEDDDVDCWRYEEDLADRCGLTDFVKSQQNKCEKRKLFNSIRSI